MTPLDLCSRALLKIGANAITSFEEGTAEAEVAAGLYPIIRDAALSTHPWNFALRILALTPLVEDTASEFSYAYQLPSDCLRVICATVVGTSTRIQYRIIGRTIYCDTGEIVLTYVARAAEEYFPAYFEVALIARLAAEFCIPLTDSTSRWEALYRLAENEARRARLTDAQEDTPIGFQDFTLVQER